MRIVNPMRFRIRYIVLAALLVLGFLTVAGTRKPKPEPLDLAGLEREFPLTWKHIHKSEGAGGAWYIPGGWIDGKPTPKTIVEAANLASEAAAQDSDRQLAQSTVPLLVHQTAATTKIDQWKQDLLPWVERWLRFATDKKQPMAYFFWNDAGILDFVKTHDARLLDDFVSLFTPVERADIFRVLVCNKIGGVYGDVDTEPIRHPASWLSDKDTAKWTDDRGETFGGGGSVRLIWGLEADTDPATNTHWRMGYTYPVQITQWAMAAAPGHPVLEQFMKNLDGHIERAKEHPEDKSAFDPLNRTGPAAVTLASSTYLEKKVPKFQWNSVTGLRDGGKSKLVDDVMILPMTAFSPGRGKYGNMGSKPVTDADARLVHHALGSWKHFDLKVEYGKFCRSFFALCRDWSKVPD